MLAHFVENLATVQRNASKIRNLPHINQEEDNLSAKILTNQGRCMGRIKTKCHSNKKLDSLALSVERLAILKIDVTPKVGTFHKAKCRKVDSPALSVERLAIPKIDASPKVGTSNKKVDYPVLSVENQATLKTDVTLTPIMKASRNADPRYALIAVNQVTRSPVASRNKEIKAEIR